MTNYANLLQNNPDDQQDIAAAKAYARQFVLDHGETFAQLLKVEFNPAVTKNVLKHIRTYFKQQGFTFETPYPGHAEYVNFTDYKVEHGVGYSVHYPYKTDLGILIFEMRAAIKSEMQPLADAFVLANRTPLANGDTVDMPDSTTFKNPTYYYKFCECLESGGLTINSERGARTTVRFLRK